MPSLKGWAVRLSDRFFDKYLSHLTANCLVCALAPLTLFSRWTGLLSFAFKCHHSKDNTSITINPSKFGVPFSGAMGVVIIITSVINVYYMEERQFFAVAELITQSIFKIKVALIGLTVIHYVGTGLMCYRRDWAVVLQNKDFRISLRHVQMMHCASFITSVYVLGACVLNLIMCCATIESFTPLNVLNVFVDTVALYIECSITLFIGFKYSLIQIKLSDGFRIMKLLLLERLERPGTSLPPSFTCCQVRHGFFVQSFKFLSYDAYPIITVWIMLTMIEIIFNMFLAITTLFDDDVVFITWKTLMCRLRMVVTTFVTLAVLVVIDIISNMGDGLRSFLFRFPISKLTTADAAQVEMLITALTIQKPVLNASDLFIVGINLIMSMTGTVVTYVLVALQFQASWTKE